MKSLLFAFLVTSSTFANVGDTEQELRKRFENPPVVKKDPDGFLTMGFWRGKVFVAAFFVDGKVATELSTPITMKEAVGLRDKQGSDWKVILNTKARVIWESKEGFRASLKTDLLSISDGRYEVAWKKLRAGKLEGPRREADRH